MRLRSVGVVVAASFALSIAACNLIVGFDELERVGATATDGGRNEGTVKEDPNESGSSSNVVDGSVLDAPLGPCDSEKPWGPPTTPGDSINTTDSEDMPSLTADELTIVFQRGVQRQPESTSTCCTWRSASGSTHRLELRPSSRASPRKASPTSRRSALTG